MYQIDNLQPGDVRAKLRSGHPRVMANEDDFARIRALVKSDPLMGKWAKNTLQKADKIVYEPPVGYTLLDGIRLGGISNLIRDHLEYLGMAYQLTGKAEYAQKAGEQLETIAAFADWQPELFLSTADMLTAAAVGYDWCYDGLTDEQRSTIVQAMVQKGLQPALACFRGTDGLTQHAQGRIFRSEWMQTTSNWSLVCNAGIVIGALAVLDEWPEAERAVLEALRSMQYALGNFYPDGGWPEGIGYWVYAVKFFMRGVSALCSALGTELGLFYESPGLDKTAYFPIYLCSNQRQFNYHDANFEADKPNVPSMFLFGRLLHDKNCVAFRLADMEAHRLGGLASDDDGYDGGPLDLLWYDPELHADTFDLPRMRIFRLCETGSMRSAWREDATFLAFHGGENETSHGHYDNGTFQLEALGERWVCDLGRDMLYYGNFDGKPRDVYRVRAEAHNVVVVDPDKGPGQDRPAWCPVVYRADGPDMMAVYNLLNTYISWATYYERGFRMAGDGSYVVVQDEIVCDTTRNIVWQVQLDADVELNSDGTCAALRKNGKHITMRLLSPGQRFEVVPNVPYETSPQVAGQADNGGICKVVVRVHDSAATIAVAFEMAPDARAPYQPLTQWRTDGRE